MDGGRGGGGAIVSSKDVSCEAEPLGTVDWHVTSLPLDEGGQPSCREALARL